MLRNSYQARPETCIFTLEGERGGKREGSEMRKGERGTQREGDGDRERRGRDRGGSEREDREGVD